FYSSRRRHTRSKRDWSSDVCSSDLPFSVSTNGTHFCGDAGRGGKPLPISSAAAACTPPGAAASRFRYHVPPVRFAHRNIMSPSQIGRASCRERVEIWATEGSRQREK